MESNDFEGLSQTFGFELESNSDSKKAHAFYTCYKTKTIHQYKINAWQHEYNKHLY
jgi:hypothetical protein